MRRRPQGKHATDYTFADQSANDSGWAEADGTLGPNNIAVKATSHNNAFCRLKYRMIFSPLSCSALTGPLLGVRIIRSETIVDAARDEDRPTHPLSYPCKAAAVKRDRRNSFNWGYSARPA